MASARTAKLAQLRGLLEAACRVSEELAFDEAHPLPTLLVAARAEAILAQKAETHGRCSAGSAAKDPPPAPSASDATAASTGRPSRKRLLADVEYHHDTVASAASPPPL